MQSKNYYEQTVYLPFLSLLFNIVQAQLRSPEYQKGKAILSGTIANYSPDDHPDLKSELLIL